MMDGYPFTADDVFITFGGHGTLDASVKVLCSRGQNILIPKPGFPLVKTICDHIGV